MSRLGDMRRIILLSLFIPALCFGQVAYHGSSILFDGALAIAAPYTVSADCIVTFEAWIQMTASAARMNTFNRITGTFP